MTEKDVCIYRQSKKESQKRKNPLMCTTKLTIYLKMKKGCLIVFASVAVILIIGAIVNYRVFFVPSGIEIDKTKFPITGIDISGHTGKIDFLKLSERKIDFVFIKATEGADFVDPKFQENYSNAVNKLPIGFYHFFRFNKSGKSQANNFLSNISDKRLTFH